MLLELKLKNWKEFFNQDVSSDLGGGGWVLKEWRQKLNWDEVKENPEMRMNIVETA